MIFSCVKFGLVVEKNRRRCSAPFSSPQPAMSSTDSMVAYALPAVFAACLVLATLPQLLAEPYPRIVTGQTVDVGSNVRLRAHGVQRARRLYILFF